MAPRSWLNRAVSVLALAFIAMVGLVPNAATAGSAEDPGSGGVVLEPIKEGGNEWCC